MLQTWNLETSVFVPIHVVFEHRASDAYKLEESALPATSPSRHGKQNEPAATRLWENSELSAYEPGERVLLAAPLMLNETSLALPAPLKESDVAEQEEKMPVVESGVQQERVVLTQVKFRQALIEVDDPAVFWNGVIGGQVAAVEEQQPLSGAQIFELFEEAVRDLGFSETWLAGYLLGLSDALLRHRKMCPRTYTALLKPLK